ncbi:MAG: hypothetical protein ACRDF4_06990 [Rhabdochlamydiaceae bacterium]
MSEDRRSWQYPVKIIEALNISDGSMFADLAWGPGIFLRFPISKRSEKGNVYAVDPNSLMIKQFKNNLKSLAKDEMQKCPDIRGGYGRYFDSVVQS